jgi:3-methyladenine DNA glycosylase AlkD
VRIWRLTPREPDRRRWGFCNRLWSNTTVTYRAFDSDALADEIAGRIRSLPVHTTTALRAVRREYSRRLASAPAVEVVQLALSLLRRGDVHRFIADELIAAHPEALRTLTAADLELLGHGLSSWDQVDSFAPSLSGPAWRERQVPDEVIHAWARSPDRWWRRTALVSTIALNVKARGGHGDTERTLVVCRLLLDDRDDMVVKALSWALRALAERDPASVRDFVSTHEQQLAPLVRREVAHKLRTGVKNPRRRTAPN